MAAPVIASSGAHSTSATCDAPPDVEAGDHVLVIAVDNGNPGTGSQVISLSGFDKIAEQTYDVGVASPYIAMFLKESSGSEPSTYTVTSGGSGYNTQAHRIVGLDKDDPVRALTGGTGFGSSTPSLSLSGLVADDLVIYADGGDQNRQMTTLPSGTTRLTASGVNRRQHAAYKVQASDGGSGSFSGTMNGSGSHATLLIALKPTSSVPAQIAVTFPKLSAALEVAKGADIQAAVTFPKFTAALEAAVASDRLDAKFPLLQASMTAEVTTAQAAVVFPKLDADYEISLSVPTTLAVAFPKLSAALSGGVESRVTAAVVFPKLRADLQLSVSATPSWEEVIRSPEWKRAAQAPTRETGRRVDMIDGNNIVVATLPITGGNVSCDATKDERWAASISSGNPTFMPEEITDLLHPLSGLRARIFWTLKLESGFVAEVPIGTYYVSVPSASASYNSFSLGVQLLDPVSRIRRNKWTGGDGMDLGGLTVSEALRRVLLSRAPNMTVQIADTTVTLPEVYEVGEPGRDPWLDVLAICQPAAYIAYADRLGTIVCEPAGTGSGETVLNYNVGPKNRMESLDRKLDETQLLNRVTVRSTSSEVDPPVYATVEDNDPASPLWVGLGPIYSEVIDSDSVTTEDQCRTLAATILSQRQVLLESLDLIHRARPEVDPLNLIAVNEPRTGANGTYQTAAWSLDLSDGAMQRTTVTTRQIEV